MAFMVLSGSTRVEVFDRKSLLAAKRLYGALGSLVEIVFKPRRLPTVMRDRLQ